MNKQRKAKLHERGARFSDRMRARSTEWDNAHDGYVEGYKAAMRDLRKVVAEAKDVAGDYANPFHRVQHKNHCVRVSVDRFLRPLR